MKTKKIVLLPLLALGLMSAGCDSGNKEVITGERELLFLGDEVIKVDPREAGKVVVIETAEVLEGWSMAGGNASHAVAPSKGAERVNLAWDASIGRGSTSSSKLLNGPIAAEGKIFTIDVTGEIRAFDLESGKLLFETDTTPESQGADSFSGGLAYCEGFLFAVTPNAEVVVLSAANGKILNRFKLSAPARSSPTVANGQVYVVNINNQTEVFDYRTNTPTWSHLGIMETVGLLGGASPAASESLVIVPYTSGEVYALIPSTGALLWNDSLLSQSRLDPISTLYHIKARPVIKDGTIYLIGNSGLVRALDARTGQSLWTQKIGGMRSPAVSGDYLFMVSSEQKLVCLNRFTGAVVWVETLEAYQDPQSMKDPIFWAGPVIHNDTLVLAGSQGKAELRSIRDGSLVQTLDLDGATYLSPILVEGRIVFLTDAGQLEVFK